MGNTEKYLRAQWRADLSRIEAQIEDLRIRIDAQSQKLRASLSAEVAALRSDLARLESAVEAAGADEQARQIAAQIEDLRAKGDAAYQLLQSEMGTQLDPTDTEIRRLQAVEATTSGDAKARIQAHIVRLQSTQAAAQTKPHDADRTEQPGDEPC
jgi:hypothetical protein